MVANPEITQGILQDTRAAAALLLEGVKPKMDWSTFISKTVFSLGIYHAVDFVGKTLGSNRLTLWEACHRRELKRAINIDGVIREARIVSYGVESAAQAKEIDIQPKGVLGGDFLAFKSKGPVVETMRAVPRAGFMEVELGSPDYTQAQYYRQVVGQFQQLQLPL